MIECIKCHESKPRDAFFRNTALGLLRDNEERMLAAVEYLRKVRS